MSNGENKGWWSNNWDKVLTVGGGAIIAGIVGFYTAIIAIKSDIISLTERTVKLETEVANIKPKISNFEEYSKKIVEMEKDQEYLRDQTDISIHTNKLLDLRLEQERSKTIKELRALLTEINIKASN